MGYYTWYNLNAQMVKRDEAGSMGFVEIPPIIKEDLNAEVEKMCVFDGGNCDDGWYGESKWYECNDDMLTLSHRFPDIFFTLYGEGEDSQDMWYAYFLDEALQYAPAVITFEDFDESKLVRCEKSELFSPSRLYSYE